MIKIATVSSRNDHTFHVSIGAIGGKRTSHSSLKFSIIMDVAGCCTAGGEHEEAGSGRALFVEGWEFMQTLGEGAYSE